VPPSFLELHNEKLPINASHSYAGKNSLKLHWISKAGGDWGVAVASPGWIGFDVMLKDSLSFWVYSEDPLSAQNLPVIYLEDIRNWKSGKLNLSDYVSDIPARQWVEARIPLQIFKRRAGGPDLSRIKTIFFGQSAADSIEHTMYLDDIKVFGGAWLAKYNFIVVLGSSTAAGAGADHIDSTWVNRFSQYVARIDTTYKVINLAVAGYSTYRIMPNEFRPPSGRAASDLSKNMSTAMDYHPKAIIINLPSNDVAYGYSIAEQVANFDTLLAYTNQHRIPLWISTTQPRNFPGSARREQLIAMRDSLLHRYPRFGAHIIDFWTEIADSSGRISSKYDSGDGIHLNNAGHRILFERVVSSGVRESLLIGAKDAQKQ
jgi:lysophospholipase L1-like esterase